MYTQPSVPTGSRRRLPAIQRVQRDLRGRPSALLIRRLLRYLRLRLLRHTQFLRSLRPTLQRPSCRPRITPLLRAPAQTPLRHSAQRPAISKLDAPCRTNAIGRRSRLAMRWEDGMLSRLQQPHKLFTTDARASPDPIAEVTRSVVWIR